MNGAMLQGEIDLLCCYQGPLQLPTELETSDVNDSLHDISLAMQPRRFEKNLQHGYKKQCRKGL